MQIHAGELTDVCRYIENNRHVTLQDHLTTFDSYFQRVSRFIRIDSSTRILEIGIGTGWFPILCKARGLSCKGLEISHQLVEFARESGRKHGIEPDVEVGNVETHQLGLQQYDLIIASAVFEHIENWREALKKIYDALKPDGVFFFEATNKFSLTSGEFHFPLYGWLPDQWRYRLRIARQGPDIMKLGIDFNQFTYPLLRRTFRNLGFKDIHDRVALADPNAIAAWWKRSAVRLAKRSQLLRELVLLFAEATTFVCVK